MVGLLGVEPAKPRQLRLFFLKNRSDQPGRWELRNEDIVQSCHELRKCGLRAIGLFHSHPLSDARLGARDRRNTPMGWHHLVYDVCALAARLFVVRRRNGRRAIEELELSIERSPRDVRRPRQEGP